MLKTSVHREAEHREHREGEHREGEHREGEHREGEHRKEHGQEHGHHTEALAFAGAQDNHFQTASRKYVLLVSRSCLVHTKL
jgi:hypothetical protein